MYRSIDCQFWSDRTIRKLSPQEKLLFLYLITNPHSHYSGLYYLPLVTMQHEVGLGRGFEGGLKGVQDHQLVLLDVEFEQILVLNMFAYQGKGKNMEKGAAAHLQTLHNSPLVMKFLERYPSVAQYWTGTPFEPPYLPLTTSPSPVLLISSLSSLSSLSESESEFEVFWSRYPRQIGKKAARLAWNKAKDRPPVAMILEAVGRAAQSVQWTKDGGQFIPHPATWINGGRWDDQQQAKPLSVMERFLARHQEEA